LGDIDRIQLAKCGLLIDRASSIYLKVRLKALASVLFVFDQVLPHKSTGKDQQGEEHSLSVCLGDKCPLTQSQRLQYLIIYNSFGIITFLSDLKMTRSSIFVYDILTIVCNNKILRQLNFKRTFHRLLTFSSTEYKLG